MAKSIMGPISLSSISLWLLLANLVERISYFACTTFFATFTKAVIWRPLDRVAVFMAVEGIFATVGSLVGGRVQKGYGKQFITGNSGIMLAISILGFATFGFLVSVWLPVAASCIYLFFDSYVRPGYIQLLGSSTTMRSVAMGWNGFSNQVGAFIGTSLPAFLLKTDSLLRA